MEKDELMLNVPDPKTIPCLTCKWGRINYLADYCAQYKIKPKKVYFYNGQCDKYEKL